MGIVRHEHYPSIDDLAAHVFLWRGTVLALELYGRSRFPIRRIHLHYSFPIDETEDIRRNFAHCALVNQTTGEYVIYLSRLPNEYAFHGQLGHELSHLLNPRLFDVYAEGLGTVFAEILLKSEGLGWTGWEEYLKAEKDPAARFYGRTYLRMRELTSGIAEYAKASFVLRNDRSSR